MDRLLSRKKLEKSILGYEKKIIRERTGNVMKFLAAMACLLITGLGAIGYEEHCPSLIMIGLAIAILTITLFTFDLYGLSGLIKKRVLSLVVSKLENYDLETLVNEDGINSYRDRILEIMKTVRDLKRGAEADSEQDEAELLRQAHDLMEELRLLIVTHKIPWTYEPISFKGNTGDLREMFFQFSMEDDHDEVMINFRHLVNDLVEGRRHFFKIMLEIQKPWLEKISA